MPDYLKQLSENILIIMNYLSFMRNFSQYFFTFTKHKYSTFFLAEVIIIDEASLTGMSFDISFFTKQLKITK